tara:strand:+ start:1247 stop:1495 length:249 start_codon:yes stop_codon:yes gene_type:complete
MDTSNILSEGFLKKLIFKMLHPIKDIRQTYQKLQKDRKMKYVMNDPKLKKMWNDLEKSADKVANETESALGRAGFSDWEQSL